MVFTLVVSGNCFGSVSDPQIMLNILCGIDVEGGLRIFGLQAFQELSHDF
jgi:hypothetical protein